MLNTIATRLRAEADVLTAISVELEARDVLESAAVAPLTARLVATAAILTRVETEVAAAGSLALVSQPDSRNWVPVAGGMDRLGAT